MVEPREAALQTAASRWVEACRHESWREREQAARELSEFPVDQLFEYFVLLVRESRDFAARNAALVWLERNATDRLFVLYDRLKDGESRLHLINLYGRMRDPKTVGILRRFLDDEDPNIVNATLETFGQIGSPLALPWIERLLAVDDPWITVPAIVAVGAIGDPRSIKKLVPYLADEFLAPQVLHALSRIGGREVLRVFVDYWNQGLDAGLAESFLEALGAIWERPMEHTERIGRELKPHSAIDSGFLSEQVRSGTSVRGRGAYWLLAWLDQAAAAQTLGVAAHHEDWLSMLREIPVSVSQTLDWMSLTKSDSVATRLVLVELAARTPHLVAVAGLLCSDSDDAVRLTVVRALAQTMHTPKALEPAERLLLAMVWDRSSAVRAVARSYFRQRGTRLIEQQAETFFDFGRPEIVREVLDDFPHLANASLKVKLERAADSQLSRGSAGAAAQLARALGVGSWTQKLKGHATALGANDPKTLDFVRAVPQPLDAESRTWLLGLLPGADTPMKHEILFVLAQDPQTAGLPEFWCEYLQATQDREISAAAIIVLGNQATDVRTAMLMRGLYEKADPYMRRLILRALAVSGHLQALDVVRALRDPHWIVRLRGVEIARPGDWQTDDVEKILTDEAWVRQAAAHKLHQQLSEELENRLGSQVVSQVRALDRARRTDKADVPAAEPDMLVLEEWVRAKIGISYRDHRLSLFSMRVNPRVQALGLASVDAYVEYLNFHPRRQSELQGLITRLTNNETYLFRERVQLDVMVQTLIPEVLRRRPEVRVASAGCSSGEEAVSIVSLWSHVSSADLERLQVFGLDIDLDILEKARAARYGDNSFRGVDPVFRYKFFDTHEGAFVPKSHIRAQTSFRWANLFDDASLGPKDAFDIILCRNVLIYFDEDGKRRVARNLYERLRPGGYMIVGLSETLSDVSYDLEPRRINSVLVYYRKE